MPFCLGHTEANKRANRTIGPEGKGYGRGWDSPKVDVCPPVLPEMTLVVPMPLDLKED